MNASSIPPIESATNADCCPLCGGPNDCQMCGSGPQNGPCWCASVQIPKALLERVPVESRNKQCICRHCIEEFGSR